MCVLLSCVSVCVRVAAFPDDPAVAENGAFALGNLCRAVGKVGNSSTGTFSAAELAPIDDQLKQKSEGVARKQAAASAGAIPALVNAMKTHADVGGLQQWGQRALSIITYENAALRDEAKKVSALTHKPRVACAPVCGQARRVPALLSFYYLGCG